MPPMVVSDSVGTMPTASALARMPRGPRSTASVRVRWFMAAFAAPYAAKFGDGPSELVDEMPINEDPACITLAQAFAATKCGRRFRSNWPSQCSSGMSTVA